VVAGDAIHVFGGSGNSTEEIAAADHETNLDPGPGNFGNLSGEGANAVGINSKASLAGHHLATQLQENT
jgi:hypothetical protein